MWAYEKAEKSFFWRVGVDEAGLPSPREQYDEKQAGVAHGTGALHKKLKRAQ